MCIMCVCMCIYIYIYIYIHIIHYMYLCIGRAAQGGRGPGAPVTVRCARCDAVGFPIWRNHTNISNDNNHDTDNPQVENQTHQST